MTTESRSDDQLQAEFPTASVGVSTRTSSEPDAGGHFGVYGGRHVPEALMAVIDDVTAAYEKMRTDDEFLGELDRLQRDRKSVV